MTELRYYKHDLAERLAHWLHTFNIVVLVLSGLQIHYPSFVVFGPRLTARFVHMASGYLFFFLGVIHVYYFFVSGKHRVAMPNVSDVRDFWPVTRYYLFLSRAQPDFEKYNVLQKAAYASLFVISVLQTALGIALYWPVEMAPVLAFFGGAIHVRIWHTTIMWIFLSFTFVHIYLVLVEDIRLLTAMLTGYYTRRSHESPE